MLSHHPECKLLTDWHRDNKTGMFYQTIRGRECHPDCTFKRDLYSPLANAKAALALSKQHG